MQLKTMTIRNEIIDLLYDIDDLAKGWTWEKEIVDATNKIAKMINQLLEED